MEKQGRRRALPVAPPRIPTPMPPCNNNNPPRKESCSSSLQPARTHSSLSSTDQARSGGGGGQFPEQKGNAKMLDNDIKAWINPRLISKIDLELIRSSEEQLMNGHYHNLSHRRSHSREWEAAVNGRATRSRPTVTALTQGLADARRTGDRAADRKPTNNKQITDKNKQSAISITNKKDRKSTPKKDEETTSVKVFLEKEKDLSDLTKFKQEEKLDEQKSVNKNDEEFKDKSENLSKANSAATGVLQRIPNEDKEEQVHSTNTNQENTSLLLIRHVEGADSSLTNNDVVNKSETLQIKRSKLKENDESPSPSKFLCSDLSKRHSELLKQHSDLLRQHSNLVRQHSDLSAKQNLPSRKPPKSSSSLTSSSKKFEQRTTNFLRQSSDLGIANKTQHQVLNRQKSDLNKKNSVISSPAVNNSMMMDSSSSSPYRYEYQPLLSNMNNVQQQQRSMIPSPAKSHFSAPSAGTSSSFGRNKHSQHHHQSRQGGVYKNGASERSGSVRNPYLQAGYSSVAPVNNDGQVYSLYCETKYAFSVNGLPGNAAQSSAAAAFFARAAQKLNLSSSPHRRKRHNSEDAEPTGFCGILQKNPPPVPPALLRRIGVKEITGVGKVKVMLRVAGPPGGESMESSSSNNFFSLDKRKKQVTLIDPSACGGSAAPEDRRVGVAAPKMFAFDAIFSQDDSQSEVCSAALTDVIHAVINGTDGCLFCFGHAGLGKSYTMLGSPDSVNTLGVIPCAISWLFRGINEQKQKTGARFSVRVSAVEICGPTNQLRDLLAGHSNDSEQSPGVYLRDDPLFGNQAPHCELRVPTAEKAAHYLDEAVECRAPNREDSRDSHLLFTLHVYQYSVAGKGGVAGGRSRLHLIDLGNSDRGKASGGIPLSGVGNILLAIFNGQKHLPYKEHKLTHLLKDCLSSLTCHAAMIAHVSPLSQNYSDTLTTVQLASRIHRMRRRRIKFVAAGTGTGSGGSSGEEATRTTGTSSEPDPSSSDLSADTVIYVGPADDATDGEHPPVYIPSLNSGDNRCSMSKALRGSGVERPSRVPTLQQQKNSSDEKTPTHKPQIKSGKDISKSSPVHSNSPKASPSRSLSQKAKSSAPQTGVISGGGGGASDEQWIDGPRISKSKVAEARHFMKEPCHVKKRETWIDGPMQVNDVNPLLQATASPSPNAGYGYMDSHKKNMIRKWVEHQTNQITKSKHALLHQKESKGSKEPFKELTQFKTYDEVEVEVVKPLDTMRKQDVEECVIRTGLKLSNTNTKASSDVIPECQTPDERDDAYSINKNEDEDFEDEEEHVEIPPALPLIQPLSSREVSLESLDQLLKERQLSNAEYLQASGYEDPQQSDEDEILEIIEVEEPLEPVPMQDSCLQVTEEDIALCMGLENPLPEVDQENPLDHPLRILSQENLTVVSTFTDSMSIYTDLERILPRHRYDARYGLYSDDYEDPDNPNPVNVKYNLDETSKQKFEQLAKLHELYTNRLAKANVANSETFQKQKGSQRVLSRCESMTLNDMLYGGGNNTNVHDNGSIYSEPAYIPDQEKFCQNCKVSMSRPATAQNWYIDPFLSASSMELGPPQPTPSLSGRFQRYCHKSMNMTNMKDNSNLAYLRHPDGASNPNLREDFERVPGNGESTSDHERKVIETQPVTCAQPKPTSLPSNRRMLSIESGLAQIKLNQQKSTEGGYDSGHDSTPRTSKHSPAAISRKAESGYDSVVRDSESSSIDSDTSRRISASNRRNKCKHKHEKSFCSWFLNPFTCKYIDEPPETHF